jgi:hypothetical protein
MQLELTGSSNKALRHIDPQLNIQHQLKLFGAEDGHYFRIVDKELNFCPVYKITVSNELKFAHTDSEISKKESHLL